MNPDDACQRFELRRFPDWRDPIVRAFGAYLALITIGHLYLGLIIAVLVFAYVVWTLRRPARHLRLSDTELVIGRIQINKQRVDEVSPSSKGVIIAWKKSGVPRYTEVRSSWFKEDVWRKAYPALLAWVALKQ